MEEYTTDRKPLSLLGVLGMVLFAATFLWVTAIMLIAAYRSAFT